MGGAREIRTEFGLTDPTLQRMLMVAERALAEPAFGNQLKMDYLSHALAAHLLTNYSSLSAPRSVAQMAPAFDGNETRRLTEYITERLASDLSIAELAGLIGVPRTQFITRFQATTNTTPHRFVMLLRIASARRLLRDWRLAIEEVGMRCGFLDAKHFATAFKRCTGLTPDQYRQVVAS
jgi:transcriptional regulator GlxA family with amidase domain